MFFYSRFSGSKKASFLFLIIIMLFLVAFKRRVIFAPALKSLLLAVQGTQVMV